MITILLVTNSLMALALVYYVVTSTIKLGKVSGELEKISTELDKAKFRLFVIEKKQTIHQQKKVV